MIKYLYLMLMIGSFIVPFIFSFHPRLKFFRRWKQFFISTFFMMIIFISWDVLFTKIGVWGFNPDYLLGINVINLPLEECLFFIMVPYACVFTHFSLIELFPKVKLHNKYVKLFVIVFSLILTVILFFFRDRMYTSVNAIYALLITLLVYFRDRELFNKFLLSYLVIIIPFLLVNGVLTGSFIEAPVVWYNNSENMGIRFFSIPIEDFVYNYSMLITVLFLMRLSDKKFKSNVAGD